MPQPCITVVVIKMLSPDITHWLSRQLAIRCALRKLMLRNVFLNRKPLLLVELPTMINPKQHTDCCTSTFMQIVVHQAFRKLMRLCILLLRYAIQNRFTTIILFVICPLGTPCLAPEVVILECTSHSMAGSRKRSNNSSSVAGRACRCCFLCIRCSSVSGTIS